MDHSKNIVKADEVIDVHVKNSLKEDLGKIEDIVLDKASGRIAYVALACGGFLGMNEKLFAIPWSAIHYDKNEGCFILNIEKEKLKNASGFDKNHWPDMADRGWEQGNVSQQ